MALKEPYNFDFQGAVNNGHSLNDIQSFVNNKYGIDFDIQGASDAGYSNEDIHNYFKSLNDGDGNTTTQNEMRLLSGNKLKYDNGKTPLDIVKNVSKFSGLNPSFLYSSAFQEGMNKAIAKPDEVSEAYINADKKGELNDFPVDGFRNYGVDTFGNKLEELKKYLPEGFDQRYKLYTAKNEKGQPVQTAAFKTNEDALMAKAAMLRNERDKLVEYAKNKNIDLDENALNYFNLAFYNGHPDSAKKMLDEYSKAKDKKAFIEKGLTTKKNIHNNIYPRITNMAIANELLSQ